MSSREVIKAVFITLPIHQRDVLMHAMSKNESAVVVYSQNKFIGVNMNKVSNIEIDEREGAWTLGRILP